MKLECLVNYEHVKISREESFQWIPFAMTCFHKCKHAIKYKVYYVSIDFRKRWPQVTQ